MSSPIAKDHKKGLDQAMINFHQKVSHNTRTHILTQLFIQEIQSINTENSPITLLDVGCGDMTISNAISHEYNVVQNTGIDLYPNKENWENYKQFDGVSFPFDDKSFDIILFSDMNA